MRASSSSFNGPSLSRRSSIASAPALHKHETENLTRSLSKRMLRAKSVPDPKENTAKNASLEKDEKLERRRTSKDTKKGIIEDSDVCLFEKIYAQGGLDRLPGHEIDSQTKKTMKKLLAIDTRQICPKTGKDWTKEWEDQQEEWTNKVIHRSI